MTLRLTAMLKPYHELRASHAVCGTCSTSKSSPTRPLSLPEGRAMRELSMGPRDEGESLPLPRRSWKRRNHWWVEAERGPEGTGDEVEPTSTR